MAAVIDLHTGLQLPEPAPPSRPQLRLVQGGRAPQARALRRTFLVRRAFVLAVAAVVLVALAQVVGAVAGSVAEAFDSPPAASGQVHVVAPGETLWSVAGDLAPQLERRVAVDDLLALNGEAPLRVGQHLQLPASFD
jgi:hypothetical protein